MQGCKSTKKQNITSFIKGATYCRAIIQVLLLIVFNPSNACMNIVFSVKGTLKKPLLAPKTFKSFKVFSKY